MKKKVQNISLAQSSIVLSSVHFMLLTNIFCLGNFGEENFPYHSAEKHRENKQKMVRTTLNSFVKIDSIGAASGLVFHENNLYIISDNSGFLTKYSIDSKKITQLPLIENPSFNIVKKIKPDFESITLFENKICVYGSGSTDKRQDRISVNLISQEVTTKSMKERYKKFQEKAGITDDEFNIEGVFFDKTYQYYCQRGNKSANKNCLFRYNKTTEEIDVFFFMFSKISGINATFTDAILVDKTIYFLASAENTDSTYNDGEIMGSVFGTINVDTMVVEHEEIISNKHKFEGITLYKENVNNIHFLLCEDNDTEVLESEIFELIYFK